MRLRNLRDRQTVATVQSETLVQSFTKQFTMEQSGKEDQMKMPNCSMKMMPMNINSSN